MKKFIAILLTAALIFSFAACGGKKDDTQDPATTGVFTDELQQEGKIIAATSPDYAPYEYYDESNNMTGFDIEAFEEIVKILNENEGTNLTVEWSEMDFSTIISSVQVGQADVGVSCFTYDPEREGQVLFTDYYLKSAQVAAVKADSDIKTLEDLKGKKLVAGNGTTGEKAALEIEGAEVTCPGDYVVMFEVLKNGGTDAVVCDEAVGLNYQSTGEFKVLDEKLVDEEVSLITNSKSTMLTEALNKAIAKFIESDKYTELKAKYGLN